MILKEGFSGNMIGFVINLPPVRTQCVSTFQMSRVYVATHWVLVGISLAFIQN